MASKERSTCFELAFEGERLCKIGDYTTGVQYFEEAVNQGTDDLHTLSAIYSQLGNAYVYLGDYVKAVQYHQHDRTLARTISDLPGEAKASSNLSNTLKMMGKYDEAIVCCQRHLDISRELSNKVGEARALYSMANVYHVKAKKNCKATAGIGQQDPNAVADLKVAIKFYSQNLSIVRELGDRAAQGKVCGSLGNTHYLLGNCAEAVMFHTERLAIAKEFGDKEAQRRAYTNLGNTHILLGKYQDAADFYLQTLSISRQLGDRAFEAQACYSLGSTYTLLGDYKRAIEYHLRHKQIAQELNDRIGMGRACWLLSNAHTSLGNHRKAKEFTTQQLQISTEIGDEAGKATAEKNLEDLSAILGEKDQEMPRVRRMSMENMQLLSLTPEQAKAAANAAKKSQKKNGEASGRSLFSRQDADLKNGNSVHISVNQATHNGHNGVLNPSNVNVEMQHNAPTTSSGANSENFFEFLSRLQGRRMDDQRAEMRGDEDFNVLPDFLQLNHNDEPAADVARVDDVIVQPNDEANARDEEEHHEKMNHMISMLARSQSKRLNEQRVSLSSLPGVRITESSLSTISAAPVPAAAAVVAAPPPDGDAADRNNNEQAENPLSLDDNFFDNLIRCQATRLNDQRSAAPSPGDPFPTPTIPDEDFFSLIVRMQSSRIDDQRCRFEPDYP